MATDTIDILLTEFTQSPPAPENDGHDLDLTTTDLQLVAGQARVSQELGIALWWFTGEWAFDQNIGVDWFTLLGTKYKPGNVSATLKAAILDVADVTKITKFNLDWNNVTRKLALTFSVDTAYGVINVAV